ncbi:aminotransferase class V-fold PLP-dependent enzyme [Pedobacter panaciterrae]|uniref:aminotransferase class V-fold PLP-dependent enzyme n=1 Tax=Pedobacter panaciterrae TaxID=363849 RepID=UPI00155DC7D3|nr:aminotransferase class V-fold PLP-dependent enzyme [Pedobacter panaciterrae]NQX55784.1 aminotransferase class V-fold PLP-dependent enzyme [Pedobacter panaciterrae]
MIPRGKLYISNKDLFTGIYYCFADYFRPQKTEIAGKNDKKLICLSVRTGFDLVLNALDFPAGSEILVTDINIPDMFKIIAGHNLTAIPLPVNKQTLNISPAELESAITPNTKAILITHLFGAIMDTDELIAIARKYNLIVFEDCAQAYAGNLYEGNPESDVVMFSFGLIKTNTAVRGAIINIKDPALHTNVSTRNEQYDKQDTSSFLKKLFKAALVKLLTTKAIYTGFYSLAKTSGKDFEEVLAGFTKGFPGDDIFKQIRYRPCLPNIKLLQKKLNNFKQHDIATRIQLANDILPHIPNNYKIGTLNTKHTYWVLPVESNDPLRLISYLRSNGFDASQKASSLVKYIAPSTVANADDLMLDNLVYLPAYPAMSKQDRNKLTKLLSEF